MSIFKAKALYTWTPSVQLAAEKLFAEMKSWPDVTVASGLRRPTVMYRKTIIAAAHKSGMAFRTKDLWAEKATGLAVHGMIYLPGLATESWPEAAHLAYTQAAGIDPAYFTEGNDHV